MVRALLRKIVHHSAHAAHSFPSVSAAMVAGSFKLYESTPLSSPFVRFQAAAAGTAAAAAATVDGGDVLAARYKRQSSAVAAVAAVVTTPPRTPSPPPPPDGQELQRRDAG
jgi:hypothetical protein